MPKATDSSVLLQIASLSDEEKLRLCDLLGKGAATDDAIDDQADDFSFTQNLTASEKVVLQQQLLDEVNPPDPEVERFWLAEVLRRRQLHLDGKLETIDYEELMNKIKRG